MTHSGSGSLQANHWSENPRLGLEESVVQWDSVIAGAEEVHPLVTVLPGERDRRAAALNQWEMLIRML
jgi:hypothetical protein